MLILGLETSCDETACAVVADGVRIRSNVIASQHELHDEYGGVVPEIASRAHVERILPVVDRALAMAGIALADVGAIAVGHRPGLIGSLLVGVSAAKALAWALSRPLVGVDHVHAHLASGLLARNDEEPAAGNAFPALGLVVSGGHTAIYELPSILEPRRLGATIDDAVGEAFDKVASMLGLGHPGGPAIDRLASEPGADDRAHDFPIARIAPGSLDFSFSGLKTSVLYAVRGVPGRDGSFERDAASLSREQRRDIAASFQRCAVRTILLKLRRAADRSDAPAYRSLLVGGGVSANSLLRRELAAFADDLGLELRIPPMELCVDNAAMIAALAHHQLAAGRIADLHLVAVPTTSC